MKRSYFIVPVLLYCFAMGAFGLFRGVTSAVKTKVALETYEITMGVYKEFDSYEKLTSSKKGPVTVYELIYEYQVDGRAYTVKTRHTSGELPRDGYSRMVYYNPRNPSQAVLIEDEARIREDIKYGLIFTIIPGIILAVIFNRNGTFIYIKGVLRSKFR